MKLPKLLHVFILTTLVTFSLISSGSSGLTQSSPSFMQQLSSCGQRLKNLAKFALVTSAALSPEIAGRSLTTTLNTQTMKRTAQW